LLPRRASTGSRPRPAQAGRCALQVARDFAGRGETAHLRSEIGGSLVLIQQVQPERTTAAVIPTRRSAQASRLPIMAVSDGQAGTSTMLLTAAIRLIPRTASSLAKPAAQPWVSPMNGGRPQVRLVGESRAAARHHASSPYRASRPSLSMTPQEVKPVMRCHPVQGPSTRLRT
jgi:hypothetical protein